MSPLQLFNLDNLSVDAVGGWNMGLFLILGIVSSLVFSYCMWDINKSMGNIRKHNDATLRNLNKLVEIWKRNL